MLATGASLSDKWVSTLGGGSVAAARHDIEDVFGAQAAAFQYQLNSHQHRIEPGDRYGSQNLRHDPVTAGMTPQTVLKLTQRRRQISKGRAVAQRTGLAFDQREVVLPVIADRSRSSKRTWLAISASSATTSIRVGYKRLLTHLPAYSHGTE